MGGRRGRGAGHARVVGEMAMSTRGSASQVRELAELFVELSGLVEMHADPAAELEREVDKARQATEQARLELEKTAKQDGGCTVS